MTARGRRLTGAEAASACRLDLVVIRRYAEIGLIAPSAEGYTDADLAELRRVRRLHEDLDLDYDAIEIVLRMARRIRILQEEIRRLRGE